MDTNYAQSTQKDQIRFWNKVEKSQTCWTWLGAKDSKGYGYFSLGPSRHPDGTRRNSMVQTHRFAYGLAMNGIADGLWVLHKCDNPSCVRPDHLFLGSALDNVRDMDAKKRRRTVAKSGSRHPNALLSEEVVRGVVRRHRIEGATQAQIARELNVSTSTINHIFTGRLWRHLKLEGTAAAASHNALSNVPREKFPN